MNILQTNTQQLNLTYDEIEHRTAIQNSFKTLLNDIDQLNNFLHSLLQKFGKANYVLCEQCALYIPNMHISMKKMIQNCKGLFKNVTSHNYVLISSVYDHITPFRNNIYKLIICHVNTLKHFKSDACVFTKWNIENNNEVLQNCLHTLSEIECLMLNCVLSNNHMKTGV